MAQQQCFYNSQDTNPITADVDVSTGVSVGDLVALQSGNVVPAGAFTYASGFITSGQNLFASLFLGHSPQTKASGLAQVYGNPTSGKIVVSTTGIYNAPLDTATDVNVGDYVAPGASGFTSLNAQVVSKVSSVANAIGVVTADNSALNTQCQFRILSTKVPAAR